MNESLLVPHFTRLEEYAGVWAMEERAFIAQWQVAANADLVAHIRQAQPKTAADIGGTEMIRAKGGKSVAVVRVVGTLMKQRASMGGTSTLDIRRQVRQAASNPDVSAILLAVDSPGGSAAGTDDLAQDVKAATRKKPVWAHISDLGASAAYWIASQAEVVYANSATALVGSIGTLMTLYDMSGLAEREGVKTLVFATGPLKGAGARGAPITEEQQAYFQGIVNATQEAFDAAVMKGRRLTATQLAAVRSGAVWPATTAKELKLIDGIKSLDATIESLAAQR